MEQLSAVVTLFLVMDPLGNVPLFLSVLRAVPPERRRAVLVREIGFALRMIFPGDGSLSGPAFEGEPFLVPLAIPLVAGPSTLATLLLLKSATPTSIGLLLLALTIAWILAGAILLSSTFLYRLLGDRGLAAIERLMGMLLVMVAVQMLMDGVKAFMRSQ